MNARHLKLGELEIAIMKHLWSEQEADVKAVHNIIGPARGICLNTVQSTMDRLYKKNLLHRDKISHAFVYSPAVTPESLMTHMINNVVTKLSERDYGSMLSAFVNLAERVDEQGLVQLEKMINDRKASHTHKG